LKGSFKSNSSPRKQVLLWKVGSRIRNRLLHQGQTVYVHSKGCKS